MARYDMPVSPGRPKGIPNKINGEIREMIICALDGVGGVGYLMRQAEENPVAFMGLVGKVLPLQVTGANGKEITFTVVTGVPDAQPSSN